MQLSTISVGRSSLLTLLCAAAPLAAQAPDWSPLHVPGRTRTFVEATIVMIQEPGSIHGFSTFTKDWYTLQVSPNASFTGYDDHAIINDGNTWYGWATRYGAFVPVTIGSGSPQLITTPAPTWTSVVLDGNDAHVFSAFTGTWTTLRFTSAPTASVDKVVAVVGDGTTAYAHSAYLGGAVQLNAPVPGRLKAAGNVGIAVDVTGTVHLFSAHRNTWTAVPASTSATIATPSARAGLVAIQDGLVFKFWTPFTLGVSQVTAGSGATLTVLDHVAVVLDGNTAHLFSGPQGTLINTTFTNTPTIASTSFLVILQDGNFSRAYSGLLGQLATPMAGNYTFQVALTQAVAVAQDNTTGMFQVYSAMRNAWFAAPQVQNATVYRTNGGVILADPAGGLHGFSARTGTWIPGPAGVPDATSLFGGNFCARTGNRLDVFNTHLPKWSTHFTATSSPIVKIHHSGIIAVEGSTAHFYGSYADRWSVVPMLAPPPQVTDFAASDECGFAFDGTVAYGFGAAGQLSNLSIFPEFWRIMTRGAQTAWHVVGEPGAIPILIIGGRETNVAIPSLGTLLVDPIGAVLQVLSPLPPTGSLKYTLTIPNDPALVGATLHSQALMVNLNQLYLTNVYRAVVY